MKILERRKSHFGPPTEIFKTHGQLGKHRFGQLCDVSGVEEFETNFFHTLLLRGDLAGLGHAGRHKSSTEVLPATGATIQSSPNTFADIWEGGVRPTRSTRLLTRLSQEVWFPGHACHALVTSLFTSLFAGKREVAPDD